MQPSIYIVWRLAWIALGAALGAVVTFIGAIAVIDWIGGAPACEPDDGVGCGAAIVFAAFVLAICVGAPIGAIAANALVHRRARLAR